LIEEFSKAVRFHLTEAEQEDLVEDLLSHLENPPGRVSEFAELVGMLRENGGHLEATRKECWEMTQGGSKGRRWDGEK